MTGVTFDSGFLCCQGMGWGRRRVLETKGRNGTKQEGQAANGEKMSIEFHVLWLKVHTATAFSCASITGK